MHAFHCQGEEGGLTLDSGGVCLWEKSPEMKSWDKPGLLPAS